MKTEGIDDLKREKGKYHRKKAFFNKFQIFSIGNCTALCRIMKNVFQALQLIGRIVRRKK